MGGTAKQAHVRGVFDAIADSYDSGNVRISFGLQRQWKRRLVAEVLQNATKGDFVLDVCCGTGDIAVELAARCPGIHVTGLDFSPSMLAVARDKGAGLPNLCWQEGDAMSLPFSDGCFSAAVISFGLRNLSDYALVLSEIKRVLRPGGFLLCLDSFVPDFALVRPFYDLYFRRVMPFVGGGIRYRKEYRWLWRSTRDFLRKDQLLELLYKVGFCNASYRSYLFGACVLHLGEKASDEISTPDTQGEKEEGREAMA